MLINTTEHGYFCWSQSLLYFYPASIPLLTVCIPQRLEATLCCRGVGTPVCVLNVQLVYLRLKFYNLLTALVCFVCELLPNSCETVSRYTESCTVKTNF